MLALYIFSFLFFSTASVPKGSYAFDYFLCVSACDKCKKKLRWVEDFGLKSFKVTTKLLVFKWFFNFMVELKYFFICIVRRAWDFLKRWMRLLEFVNIACFY